MRKDPHVRICGGLGSATTLVYPTPFYYNVSAVRTTHEGGGSRRYVVADVVAGEQGGRVGHAML